MRQNDLYNLEDELDFLLETAISMHAPTSQIQKKCRREIIFKTKDASLMNAYERNKRIYQNAFRVYRTLPFFKQNAMFTYC